MDRETLSIIISALAVVVAAVVGGAAFWRAGNSNRTAADGLQVAKDSRSIATEANSLANASNTIASEAVTAANDAAIEARRSADVAERVEVRQTERSHVSWDEAGWDILSFWSVKNVGIDIAHEASASVRIDNDWFYSEPADVHPNESIRMDFSSAEAMMPLATRELSRQMATSGIHYVIARSQSISHQITWRTAAGVWKTEGGGNA